MVGEALRETEAPHSRQESEARRRASRGFGRPRGHARVVSGTEARLRAGDTDSVGLGPWSCIWQLAEEPEMSPGQPPGKAHFLQDGRRASVRRAPCLNRPVSGRRTRQLRDSVTARGGSWKLTPGGVAPSVFFGRPQLSNARLWW